MSVLDLEAELVADVAWPFRGIVLYGCKGVLARDYLQIANMGHLADGTIEHLLLVLAEEIARLRATASGPKPAPVTVVEPTPTARRAG